MRNKTHKSPERPSLESPLAESGLLGRDPSDLVFISRSPTALLPTPETTQRSSTQLRQKRPNKKVITPLAKPSQNSDMALLARASSAIASSTTLTALNPPNANRKQRPRAIDHFLGVMNERLNDSILESSRPVELSSSRKSSREKSKIRNTISTINQNDFQLEQESKIKSNDPKDAPNVYSAKYLKPTTPASGTTFTQLNEVLDKLIGIAISNENEEERNVEMDFSMNHIFSEVVRQYFIECGGEGIVLDKCLDCFTAAQSQIPEIQNHYLGILSELSEKQEAIDRERGALRPEIDAIKLQSDFLLKTIADLRNDLERLIKHNDDLVRSITVTTNETIVMKKSIEQLDKSITSKNDELVGLNDQLQNLSSIASQYTSDSLNYTDHLKMIRERHTNAKKQVEAAGGELRSSMQKMSRIEAEISQLNQEIEKLKKETVKKSVEIQVDLISRRLFYTKKDKNPEPKEEKKEEKDTNSTEEEEEKEPVNKEDEEQKLFDKVKKEFLISLGKDPDDELEINTYDDFSRLQTALLQNEKQFHIQQEEIDDAETGDFRLDAQHPNMDVIKLFASKLASDCLDAAIHSQPLETKETQTLAPQMTFPNEIEDEKSKRKKKKKGSKFLSLIPTDYSNRECQSFKWLIEAIRRFYHQKEILNQKCFEEGTEFESFPVSVFNHITNENELTFLRDQFCWDLQNTSHAMKDECLEIDMFVYFLDEKFNEEQLAFFLLCRKDCIKIGSSVQVQTRDKLEKFNEYYLSLDQVDKLLHKWWGERYLRKMYLDLVDCSVPRPAIHLEATKRYVSMHDLLYHSVLDYQADTVRRLQELLLNTRIIPRQKMPEFIQLVRSLVPDLDKNQIVAFYKTTVAKGVVRKEVTAKQFSDMYFLSSVLHHIYLAVEDDTEDDEIVSAVKQQYETSEKELSKMLSFFKQQSTLQPDNLTLKAFFDDSQRFQSMLQQSMSSNDGNTVCANYYQYLLSFDLLFSTMTPSDIKVDEQSLMSLECAVREHWLDSVFGQKQ